MACATASIVNTTLDTLVFGLNAIPRSKRNFYLFSSSFLASFLQVLLKVILRTPHIWNNKFKLNKSENVIVILRELPEIVGIKNF
jgi:hypothetical protein